MQLRIVFGLRTIYFRKKARYLLGLERLVKVTPRRRPRILAVLQ
jgi:hypothetical protein